MKKCSIEASIEVVVLKPEKVHCSKNYWLLYLLNTVVQYSLQLFLRKNKSKEKIIFEAFIELFSEPSLILALKLKYTHITIMKFCNFNTTSIDNLVPIVI